MNQNIEKPVDLGLGKIMANQSVVEEQIEGGEPSQNIAAVPAKNTFAKPTFMMKKKF